MWCGMFCLDGEVVFIHLKQMDKIGSSALVLVFTRGKLEYYLSGVIDRVNPEFAPSDSKNGCTRTDNPYRSLALVRWPLQLFKNTSQTKFK